MRRDDYARQQFAIDEAVTDTLFNIVDKMLALNTPILEISQITGLTITDIKNRQATT